MPFPLLPNPYKELIDDQQQVEMEHDGATPDCAICGKHIGMHAISFLMLRGSYMFLQEHAVESFNVDPEIPLLPGRVPDGSLALTVDVNPRKQNAYVMHEECFEELVSFVELHS